MIDCYGAFFGQTLTFAECEALAIANIDRRVLALETNLYNSKWFDYRPLHPTIATYLCVHHYNRAYGDFMSQCFDKGKRFMVGLKGKDFMNSREKQSFWKLRQKIDDLGIRYEFFMRKAMDWCIANGWRQPPRPAHIASNNELIIDVTNAWALECREKIQYAVNPRYTATRFVGAPDQLAYEDYLVAAIMQRPHPKFAAESALYLYGALRIEAALTRLPLSAIEQAIDRNLEIVSQY